MPHDEGRPPKGAALATAVLYGTTPLLTLDAATVAFGNAAIAARLVECAPCEDPWPKLDRLVRMKTGCDPEDLTASDWTRLAAIAQTILEWSS